MDLMIFWVGFKKELEGYGIGDLGRVVAVMNAKVWVDAGYFAGFLLSRGLTLSFAHTLC